MDAKFMEAVEELILLYEDYMEMLFKTIGFKNAFLIEITVRGVLLRRLKE
jgi:hypothetical protein